MSTDERMMDEQDFRAWLIELAHGPTGPEIDGPARFFELADNVMTRMEAWKGGKVELAELEVLRDDYRAEGAVECAQGLEVLIERGRAEIAHVAGNN
jgi:hypothetical protein